MNKALIELDKLKLNTSENNLQRVMELTFDPDDEVRFRSIEALEEFGVNNEILSRVQSGLNDDDELVRTVCAELIGDWKSLESISILAKSLGDPSEIVRSAVIISLGQIGDRSSIPALVGIYPNTEGLEKVSLDTALYLLGNKHYLENLANELSNSQYRVRCATANLLSRFVKEEDEPYAIKVLEKASLKEEIRSASMSISAALDALRKAH